MTFLFSGSLLRYVGYRRQIIYEASTIDAALRVLFAEYPELEGLLMNPDKTLKRTMRLAINNEVIHSDLTRPLSAGDSVEIMTAISGG
ncbi:ThiS domain-containing protein [Caballeronia udeis]|uniref:ThiS domain-containing protein n=1 Tax=Caballeronia udeis TaxID=1232866 RepID=A0A158EZM5_9BURK|nr:MoaD/ThiS family protein [Caballeronia udeis]SAL13024.1 ThiS domain-containing protein [Caballeronia udeis]